MSKITSGAAIPTRKRRGLKSRPYWRRSRVQKVEFDFEANVNGTLVLVVHSVCVEFMKMTTRNLRSSCCGRVTSTVDASTLLHSLLLSNSTMVCEFRDYVILSVFVYYRQRHLSVCKTMPLSRLHDVPASFILTHTYT